MSSNSNTITFDYIGHVISPFKEKFAIPRQPGIADKAKGEIILNGAANNADVVKELNQFSHIWLIFVFHGTQSQGWKPLVRPPRLGGNKKVGVLATRSTFRPNPIGMSVVELTSVEVKNKQVILHVSGIDLLDKTPILDVKPYIPYSDSLPDANAGFAQVPPQNSLTVAFSSDAQKALLKHEENHPELTLLIEQVLSQDPRPAYKHGKTDEKLYGMTLYNLNVEWKLQDMSNVIVTKISAIPSNQHKTSETS